MTLLENSYWEALPGHIKLEDGLGYEVVPNGQR